MRRFLPISIVAVCAWLGVAASASAGTITGRVVDAISGAPIPDVAVGAGPVGFGLRDYTTTDAAGRYAIEEREPGAYNVCFQPAAGVNLLQTCWHQEDNRFYGRPVQVPVSGTVGGVDAALEPGTSITGQVRDWDGSPVAGVCASAWLEDNGLRRDADAVTGADGRYLLTGLTPAAVIKVVFSPTSASNGGCDGGRELLDLVEQWHDRRESSREATAIVMRPSETVAGIDGVLGPSAVPPGSAWAPAPRCRVPALRNRTFKRARRALSVAGCSTLEPRRRSARRFARGRVVAQRPTAGKRLRRGHAVQLVVSR